MAKQYKRVLLKLSGEAFGDSQGQGIDAHSITGIAEQIIEVVETGVELAVVCGGGNLVRGGMLAEEGMNRSQADYMGMLGTIINGLALQDALESKGLPCRVMTAIPCHNVAEAFIVRRALRHLEKNRVVILVGGTGNPFFTTDTAAAVRACDIGAEVVLKATKVNGVYSADPKKDPKAERFEELSYMDVLERKLQVMDLTAISMCMENHIPIIVFDYLSKGNILKVISGDRSLGTIVGE